MERIRLIKKYLPNTKVITMYARTDNTASKSDEDLKRLQEAGVDDLYIGVECGLNDVLDNLNKGYSADDARKQCLRLNAADIGHCDLLMLGTAGKGRGLECAMASAKLENEIRPIQANSIDTGEKAERLFFYHRFNYQRHKRRLSIFLFVRFCEIPFMEGADPFLQLVRVFIFGD